MHDVDELHRIANEKDLQVVADKVPVAVLGIELHGEAARVAQRLRRMATVNDGRDADQQRRALALLLEEFGACELADGLVA
jgi:hypothetical protein